jgi:hypothetical protein
MCADQPGSATKLILGVCTARAEGKLHLSMRKCDWKDNTTPSHEGLENQ